MAKANLYRVAEGYESLSFEAQAIHESIAQKLRRLRPAQYPDDLLPPFPLPVADPTTTTPCILSCVWWRQ